MSNMTLVKICSITNIEDALAAAEAGADYLGFIGVPNTPRFVTPAEYRWIVATLPETITPVVVVREAADALPYNPVVVQYYGGDPNDLGAGVEIMPVIRPRLAADLDLIASLPQRLFAVVVDSFVPGKLGGNGEVGDWSLAHEAVKRTSLSVFLAGGLNADNVARAISEVRPVGVDVSSGVEISPGRKDHAKLAAFIAAAKGVVH
jgi:phosphoribosylanthranilate isomerase